MKLYCIEITLQIINCIAKSHCKIALQNYIAFANESKWLMKRFHLDLLIFQFDLIFPQFLCCFTCCLPVCLTVVCLFTFCLMMFCLCSTGYFALILLFQFFFNFTNNKQQTLFSITKFIDQINDPKIGFNFMVCN